MQRTDPQAARREARAEPRRPLLEASRPGARLRAFAAAEESDDAERMREAIELLVKIRAGGEV